MNVAFLLYPVERVNVNEDTSFWVMWELARRGHRVWHFESSDLRVRGGAVTALLRPARLHPRKGYLPSPRALKEANLSSLDAVFIRKEPPFDNEYLYALQALDLIKEHTFIVNDPAGIAATNEKLFTLKFPKWAPESVVTGDPLEIERFVRSIGRAVIKPLDEKGGHGVFLTSKTDRNLASLAETSTESGTRKVIVQRFVDADRYGDKRILILDGEPLGAFLRKPGRRDFRANLSRGASMHDASLTKDDHALVRELAPELERRGLWFTGIDVIGRWLTEVNVTSPAGLPDIHHFRKNFPEKRVADFLERSAKKRGGFVHTALRTDSPAVWRTR